jgi:hypothetical protein
MKPIVASLLAVSLVARAALAVESAPAKATAPAAQVETPKAATVASAKKPVTHHRRNHKAAAPAAKTEQPTAPATK